MSEHNACVLIQIGMPIFIVRGASQTISYILSVTGEHTCTQPSLPIMLSVTVLFISILQMSHTHAPKHILSSACVLFLLPRLQNDFFSMPFLVSGPCLSLLPVLLDPFPIPSMTASVTYYNCFTRDMYPAMSSKPRKHLVYSMCTKIFIQGINQMRFQVTASITNEPQWQGLNSLLWLNVHIIYILPHWTWSFQLFLCLIINTCLYTHKHQSWEKYHVTF